MPIKVRIPTPLQKLTKDQSEVQADGATLAAVIDDLEKKFPGFKDRICDETGKIRRFVNVYVNEEDARFLQGEATPVKDGDDISIIPAIAGGRDRTEVRSRGATGCAGRVAAVLAVGARQ